MPRSSSTYLAPDPSGDNQQKLTLAPNIYERGGRIYVQFKYEGRRVAEPVGSYPATQATRLKAIASAIKKLGQVETELQRDEAAFDYVKHFPRSARAKRIASDAGGILFEVAAEKAFERWLAENPQIKPKNRQGEKNNFARAVEGFKGKPVHTITRGDVMDWLFIDLKMLSVSRRKNLKTYVDKTFDYCLDHKWVSEHPSRGISIRRNTHSNAAKKRAAQSPLAVLESAVINPFSLREVQLIIESMPEGVHKNLVQFAIYTGMRPGELFGLRWEDITWTGSGARIAVNVQCAAPGEFSGPKAESYRTFDALQPAVDALNAQHKLTGRDKPQPFEMFHTQGPKAGQTTSERGSWVFKQPKAGGNFTGANNFRDTWNRIMTRAQAHAAAQGIEIEHRPFYQCRHTFASMLLTKNAPIQIIARHMGHRDISTCVSHYAQWIIEDAPDEAAILNALMGLS